MTVVRHTHRLSDLDAVPDDMLRVLQQFMGAKKPFNTFADREWHPPTDVYETDSHLVVMTEVAGLRIEDIVIEVTPSRLYIRGQRYDAHRESHISFRRMEIKFGYFDVQLPLWPGLDYAAAQATYNDGFLEVTFPKRQADTTTVVTIRITEG